MSRLASAGKMQFYPTSSPDTACITQRLHAAGKARVLDPCAGEGAALAQIVRSLNETGQATGCAVELDADRANLCKLHFPQTTINSDWLDVFSSNEAVSLLYLNPPYDYETIGEEGKKKSRLEWNFLRSAEDKLQAGGVLVYVVPMMILANKRTAAHLAAHYEDIRIYSVVDDEFPKFKQVVLFAIKRRRRQEGNNDIAAMIVEAGTNRPPAIDGAPIEIYEVPEPRVPESKYTFRHNKISRADLMQVYAAHGVQHTDEYKAMDHPDKTVEFQPVIQLKTGHIAAMVSSGATPVMNLGGKMIMRGSSTKVETVKDKDGHILKAGRDDPDAARISEAFVSALYMLKQDGTYDVLENKPAAFQKLLDEYGQEIHADITTRYAPLYDAPTPEEWAQTGKYMHGKKLPGMKKSGLLPMQRHVVAAGARTLKKHKQVIVVAEMGTGKTAMASSMIDMISAWPAILYVPGHMVEKWKTELTLAVPDAKGFIAYSIADITRFIRDYKPGDKWALIMGYEKAKLGAGPVAMKARPGTRRYQVFDRKDEHGNVVGKTKILRACCPKCGAFVTLKGSDQALKCKAVVGERKTPDGKKEEVKCGEPLYQKSRVRRWPFADYIRKQAKGVFKTLVCDEVHKAKGGSTDIGRAFHQLTMATDYTINLTGTLFGGKSTDLFYLLYRLMPEVRERYKFSGATDWAELYGRLEHVLIQDDEDETTAHFSGRKVKAAESVKEKPGISPRIYQLLLKTAIFLRIQDLGYKLPAYDEDVVTLQMAPQQKAQYEWLYETLYNTIIEGLKSFDRYEMQRARQLLSVWLTETLYQPNASFRSRPILWIPPHDKGVATDHMPWMAANSADYGYTAEQDAAHIKAGAIPIPMPPGNKRGFVGLGPKWEPRKDSIMHLYPTCKVDELLPKEQWLLDFCKHEKKHNRKTIIGIQQTAKRDIQPRIMAILAGAGIKSAVLPDELAPAKREAWIAQRAPSIDVLLTNPKKVETGLDLIAFANLIVYELPTSLFTLAQFVRRVWRLGQTQDVRTYYLVYEGTMEHRMLGLVAQKVMAAALLYGDSASTAMSAEAETDDVLAELAKQAMEKLPIEDGILAVLATTMQQETVDVELEDVDTEALAAEFDAAEHDEEEQAEETEEVTIGMSDADQEDDYVIPWWQQWQNLAKQTEPTASKKAKKPTREVAAGQLDFFALAMAAEPQPTKRNTPQTAAIYAAAAESGTQIAMF